MELQTDAHLGHLSGTVNSVSGGGEDHGGTALVDTVLNAPLLVIDHPAVFMDGAKVGSGRRTLRRTCVALVACAALLALLFALICATRRTATHPPPPPPSLPSIPPAPSPLEPRPLWRFKLSGGEANARLFMGGKVIFLQAALFHWGLYIK